MTRFAPAVGDRVEVRGPRADFRPYPDLPDSSWIFGRKGTVEGFERHHGRDAAVVRLDGPTPDGEPIVRIWPWWLRAIGAGPDRSAREG